ncbi:Ig-like domain-containing protein [Embleya sp. AB8]|uniref:Ig-like domain-containing protein n=1 Tax=Embleya sp. AB8 TaxID=3156304 RepID=UPI003C724831
MPTAFAAPTRTRRAGAVLACCAVLFAPTGAQAADPRPGPPAPVGPPAPRAVADRAETRAGQPVDVPILDNDIGEGLVVLSYTMPEHGLVFRPEQPTGPAAVLRYTPGPGFTGRDGFRYTIGDRLGRQAGASVRIDVLPAGSRAGAQVGEPISDRLSGRRGVGRLRPAAAEWAPRPHSTGAGADGRWLLLAFLASALPAAGVLVLVARRRPTGARVGRTAPRHALRNSRVIR